MQLSDRRQLVAELVTASETK